MTEPALPSFGVRLKRHDAPPGSPSAPSDDPLPPMPLNRPASAIGWAYPPAGEQARRQASLGAAGAPARARAVARPPSAVPEDAEVVEVFARAAAASGGAPLGEAYPGLPPSLARTLHHSGDDGAHGPPASGVPPVRNKAPQYNLLLPQSAATAATASLDANYQLRAKDAQSLYGDRACEGPTKAIRRGCLAPMGCSAPPRDSKEPNGGDELDDDEPGGHAGSEDQERSGGAGGLSMKTLSNSLSNLAAYFGVVHKSEILTAEEMAAAEAAQQRRALFMHEAAARKAAQQAQAYPAGPAHAPSRIDPVASAAAFLAQPPASEIRSQSIGVSRLQGLPSPAAPLHAVALDAESAAFAFEAAWKERQRLRDQGLSRSDADAVVMGLGSPYAQVVPPAGGTPDATSRVNVARHHLAVHVAPAPLPVHMRGDSKEEEEYGNVVAAPPVPAAALEPLRGRRGAGGGARGVSASAGREGPSLAPTVPTVSSRTYARPAPAPQAHHAAAASQHGAPTTVSRPTSRSSLPGASNPRTPPAQPPFGALGAPPSRGCPSREASYDALLPPECRARSALGFVADDAADDDDVRAVELRPKHAEAQHEEAQSQQELQCAPAAPPSQSASATVAACSTPLDACSLAATQRAVCLPWSSGSDSLGITVVQTPSTGDEAGSSYLLSQITSGFGCLGRVPSFSAKTSADDAAPCDDVARGGCLPGEAASRAQQQPPPYGAPPSPPRADGGGSALQSLLGALGGGVSSADAPSVPRGACVDASAPAPFSSGYASLSSESTLMAHASPSRGSPRGGGAPGAPPAPLYLETAAAPPQNGATTPIRRSGSAGALTEPLPEAASAPQALMASEKQPETADSLCSAPSELPSPQAAAIGAAIHDLLSISSDG